MAQIPTPYAPAPVAAPAPAVAAPAPALVAAPVPMPVAAPAPMAAPVAAPAPYAPAPAMVPAPVAVAPVPVAPAPMAPVPMQVPAAPMVASPGTPIAAPMAAPVAAPLPMAPAPIAAPLMAPGMAPPVAAAAAPAVDPGAMAFDLAHPSMEYEDEAYIPIPSGPYALTIESAEPATDKNGKGRVKVKFVVAAGPQQGRKVTVSYAVTSFTNLLRGLLDACFGDGQGWDRATGQFGHLIPHMPGRTIIGTVSHRKADGYDNPFPEIRGHKMYTG